MNPLLATDAYKVDHRRQYPAGTEFVYSNLTARSSRVSDTNHVVFFGLQHFIATFLEDEFNRNFFDKNRIHVVKSYKRRIDSLLGPGHSITFEHVEALWDLGYLPVRISAVPEGTRVPLRIPMLTIENTHPDFAWVTNYLETVMSAALWGPITSATLADRLRRLLDDRAKTSGDEGFVQFQGHDFSYRGMWGTEAAALSGAAHLTSFVGSDTLPAMELLDEYYYPGPDEMTGVSVAATEHSVMCAGGEDDELTTYTRLLDLYPTGIVSVVSDTWDLWNVITTILPQLRDKIMERDGRLVIRPDSGDPTQIICGIPGTYSGEKTPAEKGVVELLWGIFGGTINEKGYKVLDTHVGVIYGDSINFERADAITQGLINKGFASTNIVLGVGSYTYQYNTRDTFGMAMKATWVQINGEGRDIFKDPKTDDGVKKSAKGRLAVSRYVGSLRPANDPADLYTIEGATASEEAVSLIQPVWENGHRLVAVTLQGIRELLNKGE